MILLFLHSPNYNVFWVKILHVCRSQHCPYQDLISDFFETWKSQFWIFLENEILVGRATFIILIYWSKQTSSVTDLVLQSVIVKPIYQETLEPPGLSISFKVQHCRLQEMRIILNRSVHGYHGRRKNLFPSYCYGTISNWEADVIGLSSLTWK
jgi:hypothetical protein